MRTLGFPELVDVTDRAIVRKYVREAIVEKIIYRDLPRMVKIKDITVLESLLNIIVEEPGQLFELDSLASDLKISRRTVSAYLSYLEQSFLVRKLYNFSTGRRKVERKLKKYYPTVASVDLLFRDDDLSRSRALEWLVVTQLRAEFFWRDARKNEVDVILPDGPTAIEVKYGRTDAPGLVAFAKKHKAAKLYVISSRETSTRKMGGASVTVVPAYEFLLRKA
ncbi:MAG: DUF4143 domain-containing protein [Candidatus Thermoplasmatota archaeon]